MLGFLKSKEQKAIVKFWKSEVGQRLTTLNGRFFGPGGVWELVSPEEMSHSL